MLTAKTSLITQLTPILRTLIVDDEPRFSSRFHDTLKKHFAGVLSIREANSASEAREKYFSWQPDLLFLDVEMPDENGFELLSTLSGSHSNVVFTTGHEGYALKAIKANALDYLLKPVSLIELKETMERVFRPKLHETPSNSAALDFLPGKLRIPHANGLRVIDVANIVHLKAEGNYTSFHLDDNTKVMATGCIKEFANLLDSSRFARIHKSHVIHLDHVKEYFTDGIPYVVLSNGDTVEVSRRRKEYFLNCIRNISTGI